VSRLYQYADSSDKSGLFLLDGYQGRNTTFQVSPPAKKLLQYLDYEPGVRNRNRGPQIPDELHWGLFEIGWVYTNGSRVTPPTNEAGEIVVGDKSVEITEEIAEELKLFLQQEGGDDIEELANILNLNLAEGTANSSSGFSKPSRTHICCISDDKCHRIGNQIAERLRTETHPIDQSEWKITCIRGEEMGQTAGKYQIIINIEHKISNKEQYFHKIIFSPESGIEMIWTMTNIMIDWAQRVELEHHRREIIRSIVSVATDENIDIGDPMCDLELITEHSPSVAQFSTL
jgi:hypothetical protein